MKVIFVNLRRWSNRMCVILCDCQSSVKPVVDGLQAVCQMALFVCHKCVVFILVDSLVLTCQCLVSLILQIVSCLTSIGSGLSPIYQWHRPFNKTNQLTTDQCSQLNHLKTSRLVALVFCPLIVHSSVTLLDSAGHCGLFWCWWPLHHPGLGLLGVFKSPILFLERFSTRYIYAHLGWFEQIFRPMIIKRFWA